MLITSRSERVSDNYLHNMHKMHKISEIGEFSGLYTGFSSFI